MVIEFEALGFWWMTFVIRDISVFRKVGLCWLSFKANWMNLPVRALRVPGDGVRLLWQLPWLLLGRCLNTWGMLLLR